MQESTVLERLTRTFTDQHAIKLSYRCRYVSSYHFHIFWALERRSIAAFNLTLTVMVD